MHKTAIWGWGANARPECYVEHPELPQQVCRRDMTSGGIARGLGRSYGDQATNANGSVIDMTGVNRYHAFDPETGALTCEAGVSLAQIIADFTPRGWFPAITPGTKFVTIGGCIANDVHGKAHHSQGSFCTCVDSMTLLLANGDVVTASRTDHPDLFWANFGGMGLLGTILTATIRLRKIDNTYFRKRSIVVRAYDELIAAFDEYSEYPYSVAWIDPLATGDRLGSGVLTIGDHAKTEELPAKLAAEPFKISGPPKISVPFELPEVSLNPLTLRVLNRMFARILSAEKPFDHYEGFFYPLDMFGHWNRAYGASGFTQWQFVVPKADGPKNMRTILEAIASSGQLPFLNVLKTMGPASQGHLSFPFEGYTFAIDFPIRKGLSELLSRLDHMVLDAGGRIYLGKDSFVQPEVFRQMYTRFDEWLAVKAKYDPHNRWTSDLGRRVGLVTA